MLAHWPRERAHTHDAVVDLDDLRDRAYGALTDHEPRALTYEFGVGCFVEERPRETGFILAVEVDNEVQFG
jgi:hypothetical protein